jgi:predicted nucleic acid-binding Zn ribbon protein
VECPVCHKDFTPIRIGQTRCSAACSVKWWNNIRKVKQTERTCVFCDGKFSGIGLQRFCSKKCGVKSRYLNSHPPKERIEKVKEPIPVKLCVICGDIVGFKRQKTCSVKCGNILHLRTKSIYRKSQLKVKHCINCGSELSGGHRVKYCSFRCGSDYYDKNIRDKEKTRAASRKYRLIHKKEKTLKEKIIKKISNKIREVLRGEKHSVNYRDVISYKDTDLRLHLEKGFQEGMSWDNYGEWHIDHKIPVSAFNLMCDMDVKRCWSLSNLQPLWALDNLKKSNKLKSPFQPLLL